MKTNLVDFDLAKAKDGAKVVTRDGERARIICYDKVDDTDLEYPIVALIMAGTEKGECMMDYTLKGKWNGCQEESCKDLMIEETEFEDGDIIAFGNLGFPPIMAIFKGYWKNDINDPGLIYHVCLHMGTVDYYNGVLCNSDNLRLATEEEKHKLFDALKKDGKQWNTERKCIEELPRNTHEFKPFDKVLVRDKDDEEWQIELFGVCITTVDEYPLYKCFIQDWRQCIPYEGNESLLGTTGEPSN